jgi:prolipoprotein diacylglyceryltransferase
MKKRTGNIGHSAHFGGAIGGLLMAIVYVPSQLTANPIAAICLLAPLVIMGVLLFRESFE